MYNEVLLTYLLNSENDLVYDVNAIKQHNVLASCLSSLWRLGLNASKAW